MALDQNSSQFSDDTRDLARRDDAPSNGNGSNGGNGHADTLNVDDPRTRVLLEQLLTTLSQDSAPQAERALKAPAISNYIGVWKRRWKPMLLVFLLALAAVAYKLKPGENYYVTTATLLLPHSGDNAASALQGLVRDAPGGAIETHIAIIQSLPFKRKVLERAKQRLLKKQKPVEAAKVAASTIQAAAPVSIDLIDITVTSPSGDAAMEVANTCADAFAERLSSQGQEVAKQNLAFVKKQKDDASRQLEAAKFKLKQFKQKNHVFEIASTLAKEQTTIADLENRSRAARIDADAGDTGSTILADPITTSYQQKSADARLNYEAQLRTFYPSAPEAQRAKSQWDAAEAQVKSRIARLVQQARQQANDTKRELDQARASAERLPEVEFRLSQLLADVNQLSDSYKQFADRYLNQYLSRSSKTATATAVSPAEGAVPAVRTWTRAIMTALICALVMALICAVLLEQTDHSIHTAEDLDPLLPVAVLGSMPLLKGRRERRLAHITGAQPQAPLVLESCRIIRSNLAFATMDAPAQTILITSADPGEGKSLSALNLATVMAFDGRRVLLLDCDLRRPSQHTLNGLPLEPGFTNVLSGEASFDSALQSTSVEGLKVLTAGTLPLNPPELLGNRDTRRFVQSLKQQFDIIVIDSPPVLSLTDAQVLCAVADGVALVVAADSTPKAHVQRAQGMLRHAGGRLLGAIFNKVKQYNNPDAYGGYYGEGSSYGGNLLGRDKQLSESVGTIKTRS